MLTELTIENFLLIEKLDCHFEQGLTIITGETGAGKSIILDALSLCLGSRGHAGCVRKPAQQASLTAQFTIENLALIQNWLAEHDLAHEKDCILRRVISTEGRSRCWVNSIPVTANLLRELGQQLVNLHGQHAQHDLFKRDKQRDLLDAYAGHDTLLEKTKQAFEHWQSCRDELNSLKAQQSNADHFALLRYQFEELTALDIQTDEFEALKTSQKQLANHEQVLNDMQQCLALLDNHESSNCLQQLQTIQRLISSHVALHPKLNNALTLTQQALIEMQEATDDIDQFVQHQEHDPVRQQQIEIRLKQLFDVARKHQVKPETLCSHYQTLNQQLNSLVDIEKRLVELEEAIARAEADFHKLATKLSASRTKTAKQLAENISSIINNLGMPDCRLHIALSATDKPNLKGVDVIEFQIQPHPEQNLEPLTKIASGGELSRISLAIQVVLATCHPVPTLIFDEVDVGIGGAVAEMVGQQLRTLSQQNQIFCITHLPQVAALGHQHFKVIKSAEPKLQTSLQTLSHQAKVEELARMLGGIEINAQTLAHAETLLLESCKD